VHCEPGDFASNRIEGRQDNGIGGVIDEDGDACGCFEGPDVAAFSADNAAFNFFVWEGDGCGIGFERMIAGVALNGVADNPPGFLFGPQPGVFKDMAGQIRGISEAFLLNFFQDQGSGFIRGNMSGFEELLPAQLDLLGEFFALVLEGGFLLFEEVFLVAERVFLLDQAFQLAVDQFVTLIEAVLEFREFLAALRKTLLGIKSLRKKFFVGLKMALANYGLGVLPGFFQKGFSLLLLLGLKVGFPSI